MAPGRRGLTQGLLQQVAELLELIMVKQPIAIGILCHMAGFQHPAILKLLQQEVLGIKTSHGYLQRRFPPLADDSLDVSIDNTINRISAVDNPTLGNQTLVVEADSVFKDGDQANRLIGTLSKRLDSADLLHHLYREADAELPRGFRVVPVHCYQE